LGAGQSHEPIRTQNTSSILGPYLYDEAEISVFSNRLFAENFLNELPDKNEFKIIEIKSISGFLKKLLDPNYFLFAQHIYLNPSARREFQGYFIDGENGWILRNIFGYYKINQKNEISDLPDHEMVFAKEDKVDHKGAFNLLERNLFSTLKLPHQRIASYTKSTFPEEEAIYVVEKELQTSIFQGNLDWEHEIDINQIGINNFLVFGFDKISGNYFSNNGLDPTPYIFEDIFEACSFVCNTLFPADYEINLNGYATATAFEKGSKDDEIEEFILMSKRKGIKKLMQDILFYGYKPEYANRLRDFVNLNSPILHIKSCGYLSDLAIYKDSIYFDYLNDPFDDLASVKKTKLRKLWRSSRSKNIPQNPEWDTHNSNLKIILADKYKALSPESLFMLISAISEYEMAGINKLFDYAGISMKLSKVFERELKKLVFDKWIDKDIIDLKRKTESWIEMVVDPEDITLKIVLSWIKGKQKLTLGNMRFILKRIRENPDNPILVSIKKHINNLPSHKFLLSQNIQELLKIITTKYRNGGVHEHMVTYDICKEAFDKVVTGDESGLKMLF
jgi:hypothetical protein